CGHIPDFCQSHSDFIIQPVVVIRHHLQQHFLRDLRLHRAADAYASYGVSCPASDDNVVITLQYIKQVKRMRRLILILGAYRSNFLRNGAAHPVRFIITQAGKVCQGICGNVTVISAGATHRMNDAFPDARAPVIHDAGQEANAGCGIYFIPRCEFADYFYRPQPFLYFQCREVGTRYRGRRLIEKVKRFCFRAFLNFWIDVHKPSAWCLL
ncbi:MAG TPA: hypothetical protein VIF12_05110, partial [Micavibrio sp.]